MTAGAGLAEFFRSAGPTVVEAVPRHVDATFAPDGLDPPESPDTSERLVVLDLGRWPLGARLDVDRRLQERNTEHVWQGARLLVPERVGPSVDQVLHELVGDVLSGDAVDPGGSTRLVPIELGNWSADARLALGHALAGRGELFAVVWRHLLDGFDGSALVGMAPAVAHAWAGTTLHVREHEAHRIRAIVTGFEAGGEGGLDPEGDLVAFDVADLTDVDLTGLLAHLLAAGVRHELTHDQELVVERRDEAAVDGLLDAVDHPDALEADLDVDWDAPSAQDVLSDLFVAADRLRRDASSAEGIEDLLAGTAAAESMPVPFGFTPDGWQALVGPALALRDLIATGPSVEDGVRALADELRSLLRPLV